jgi:FixJ family two-component response regulator
VNSDTPLVYVLDDDEALRDALGLLLASVGLRYRSFADAPAFLRDYDREQHGCLIADIRMPGMDGLQLQRELIARGEAIPIIFITGHGDVPMAVEAMKAGALDFIQKPFPDQELLDRVHQALAGDREQRQSKRERFSAGERFKTLTPREQEVMRRVVSGQANKVIALDLGVSQRTVEIHRARVMQKMGARSLAELVNMAGKIDGLAGQKSAI